MEPFRHGAAAAGDDRAAADDAFPAVLASVINGAVPAAVRDADEDGASFNIDAAIGIQSVRISAGGIYDCDIPVHDADDRARAAAVGIDSVVRGPDVNGSAGNGDIDGLQPFVTGRD